MAFTPSGRHDHGPPPHPMCPASLILQHPAHSRGSEKPCWIDPPTILADTPDIQPTAKVPPSESIPHTHIS